MKTLSAVAVMAGLAAAACSMPAAAQFAKPDDAIKYRQSALFLMSSHFGRMEPVVKGQAPYDAERIKENVALVRTLSTLPWAGFVPGSEGGGARPEVWSDPEGFEARQRLQGSMEKLSAAADSGDLARLRTAFGDVGASCKACHDSFRRRR